MTAPPSREIEKPTFRGQGQDTLLNVYAQPRASRTRILGLHGDALKIAVAAPPVDGAANKALIKFLAHAIGVAKAQITLEGGATGRHKRIRVKGLSPERVAIVLGLSPASN